MCKLVEKVISTEKISYYTPCDKPLIAGILKEYGCPMYVTFLSSDNLSCLPNYLIGKNNEHSINIRHSKYLNHKSASEMLGIKTNYTHFSDFVTAKRYLKRKIERNESVMVGVTTYYLPYSSDYLSTDYLNNYPTSIVGINNHLISVVGYNSDINEYMIYDVKPNPHFFWLDEELFKKSWLGDGQIRAFSSISGIRKLFPYTYAEVEWSKYTEQDLINASQELLKTTIEEYISGRIISNDKGTYYFGYSANRKLIEVGKELENESQHFRKQYGENLVEARFSRYFFRDFYECCCIFDGRLIQFKAEVIESTDEIDKLIIRVCIELKKCTKDVEKLLKQLNQLFDKEYAVFDAILDYLTMRVGKEEKR